MANVAPITGTMVMDPSAYITGLNQAASATASFQQGVNGITFAGFNRGMIATTTLLYSLSRVISSMSQGMEEFSNMLGRIGTVADLTATSVQALADSIKTLSIAQGVSRKDIMGGMYTAAQAGFDTPREMRMMGRAGALLSRASGKEIGVKGAVDLLAGTRQALGIGQSAITSNRMTDILLRARDIGRWELDEMAEAIGKVSAVYGNQFSNTLGGEETLRQIAAIMSVVSLTNLPLGMVATGTRRLAERTFQLRNTGRGKNLREALRGIGYTGTDPVMTAFNKGPMSYLQDLLKITGGTSEGLYDLGYQSRELAALTGAMRGQGGRLQTAYQQLSYGNVAGTTERYGAKMMQTYDAQREQLRAQWEITSQEFMKASIPLISQFVSVLEGLNKVAQWLPDSVKSFLLLISAMASFRLAMNLIGFRPTVLKGVPQIGATGGRGAAAQGFGSYAPVMMDNGQVFDPIRGTPFSELRFPQARSVAKGASQFINVTPSFFMGGGITPSSGTISGQGLRASRIGMGPGNPTSGRIGAYLPSSGNMGSWVPSSFGSAYSVIPSSGPIGAYTPSSGRIGMLGYPSLTSGPIGAFTPSSGKMGATPSSRLPQFVPSAGNMGAWTPSSGMFVGAVPSSGTGFARGVPSSGMAGVYTPSSVGTTRSPFSFGQFGGFGAMMSSMSMAGMAQGIQPVTRALGAFTSSIYGAIAPLLKFTVIASTIGKFAEGFGYKASEPVWDNGLKVLPGGRGAPGFTGRALEMVSLLGTVARGGKETSGWFEERARKYGMVAGDNGYRAANINDAFQLALREMVPGDIRANLARSGNSFNDFGSVKGMVDEHIKGLGFKAPASWATWIKNTENGLEQAAEIIADALKAAAEKIQASADEATGRILYNARGKAFGIVPGSYPLNATTYKRNGKMFAYRMGGHYKALEGSGLQPYEEVGTSRANWGFRRSWMAGTPYYATDALIRQQLLAGRQWDIYQGTDPTGRNGNLNWGAGGRDYRSMYRKALEELDQNYGGFAAPSYSANSRRVIDSQRSDAAQLWKKKAADVGAKFGGFEDEQEIGLMLQKGDRAYSQNQRLLEFLKVMPGIKSMSAEQAQGWFAKLTGRDPQSDAFAATNFQNFRNMDLSQFLSVQQTGLPTQYAQATQFGSAEAYNELLQRDKPAERMVVAIDKLGAFIDNLTVKQSEVDKEMKDLKVKAKDFFEKAEATKFFDNVAELADSERGD